MQHCIQQAVMHLCVRGTLRRQLSSAKTRLVARPAPAAELAAEQLSGPVAARVRTRSPVLRSCTPTEKHTHCTSSSPSLRSVIQAFAPFQPLRATQRALPTLAKERHHV